MAALRGSTSVLTSLLVTPMLVPDVISLLLVIVLVLSGSDCVDLLNKVCCIGLTYRVKPEASIVPVIVFAVVVDIVNLADEEGRSGLEKESLLVAEPSPVWRSWRF